MELTDEIETLAAFDARVAADPKLRGVVVQSVDLTGRDEVLGACQPAGAVFLGCAFTDAGLTTVRDGGGLVFPVVPDVPVDPYRPRLYTPEELFDSLREGHYEDSVDARVYAWTKAQAVPPSLEHTLVASLHDHSIGDALADFLDGVDPRGVVGVMGGHALQRGTEEYRDAVELGASLARSGRLVVTGGGPGAMEAANLGAWLSEHSSADRDEACAMLAAAPSFRPSIDEWARAALAVRDRFGEGVVSLGIPTWFYGHEPPNAFATSIAKYFSNALREDILLALCRGGLVYLPGAAGTVQELFQAVTGNYYAGDVDRIAPLVLVGTEQWTTKLPAWPLLQALGEGKPMGERIFLVDGIGEAASLLA